ncbi:MAG: T9SS type A sorting domain-containing protein [Candidatus Zixiibacteriota bacterium]
MKRKISNRLILICWGLIYFLLSGCGGKLVSPENDNVPYEIKIDYKHDVHLGYFAEVSIDFTGDFSQVSALDLRIAYDPACLYFAEAYPGGFLVNNKWIYFSYNHVPKIDTGDVHKPPMIHLYAFKGNGTDPILSETPTADSTAIVTLTFLVKDNPDNSYTFSPIRFYWEDCYDNLVFTDFTDSAISVAAVYDTGQLIWLNEFNETGNGFTPFICPEESQIVFLPILNFSNGGFNFSGDTTIYGARGDININGVPFEIADAVMLTSFFISGYSAFGSHIDSSIAASDVNNNGIPLEVADLDYLIRIIQGDGLPYWYLTDVKPVEIIHYTDGENHSIYYDSPYDLGGMFFEFEVTGDVSQPILIDNANGMDIISHFGSGVFRILIYNIGSEKIEEGNGSILSFQSSGDVNLNYIEISHYEGITVPVEINSEPTVFELMQNYPNPFSASTAIQIALAFESDWTIEIFNMIGEIKRTLNGHSTAGMIEIIWDGKDDNGDDVPGGVYFYRCTAGGQTNTKKMMLLREP